MQKKKNFFFFFCKEFQTKSSALPLFFERQGIAARLEMFCHSGGQNRTRSPECLMEITLSLDRVISIKYLRSTRSLKSWRNSKFVLKFPENCNENHEIFLKNHQKNSSKIIEKIYQKLLKKFIKNY